MQLLPAVNKARNLLLSLLLALGVLTAEHLLLAPPLKVVDSELLSDGTVRYAYVGDTVPARMEEGEVLTKRTESSYTVYLGKDDEGNDVYRTRAYTAPTFVQDGLAWHVVEYGRDSEASFLAKTRSTTLDRLARFFGEPTYAVTVFGGTGDDGSFSEQGSWNSSHDAVTGTELYSDFDSTLMGAVSCNQCEVGSTWAVSRMFLPFNTSSIPSSASVTAASLNVYVELTENSDNDGNDFVTVVRTSQATHTGVTDADFDQAGSINNPTEGIDAGQRKDITSISTSAYLSFTLNATGLGWVAKSGEASNCSATTGYTCLGIREGHDVLDNEPNSNTANFFEATAAENTGTSQDPYLDVTYVTGSIEQEGYRWRDDDGSESGASWLAVQDTSITREAGENTRLRVLLNATDDPASTAYQLEYKLSTDMSWTAVPTSYGGVTNATIGKLGTDTTDSETDFDVQHSHTLVAGTDRAVVCTVGIENAANVTAIAGTYGGQTMQSAVFDKTGSSGTINVAAILYLLEANLPSDGANTVIITPAGSASSANVKVTCGEYENIAQQLPEDTDSLAEASPGDTTIETTVVPSEGAWVISVVDAGNVGNWAHGQSQQETAEIDAASSSSAAAELRGATAGSIQLTSTFTGTANRLVRASASFAAATSSISNPIIVATSTQITASGENTTAQLTAPSGKTTGDFDAGRIQDDENPADAVDITSDDYTEMEWALIANPAEVTEGQIYQFRVTASGSALDTYSVTPQWTIGAAAAAVAKVIRLMGVRLQGVRLQ